MLCVEDKSVSRNFLVAVSKSTIPLKTKFCEIWRAFLVASFCLLYPCDDAVEYVEMFDEVFGTFDQGFKELWLHSIREPVWL